MLPALTSGVVVGLSIAVFVGYAAMSVIETAALGGLGNGLTAALGIATVDGLWAAVVAAAGTPLDRILGPYEPYLRWAAFAALAYLGVLAVRQVLRPDPEPAGLIPQAGVYRVYLTATLRDPVTVIFFGSLILGSAPRYGPAQASVFALGAFLGSLAWQSALAGVGARRGRTFTARGRRRLAVLDCALLAVFTAYIALGWYR